MEKLVTNTSIVAEDAEDIFENSAETYFRFSVDHGMQKVTLDM
jgi:hypothetical protein